MVMQTEVRTTTRKPRRKFSILDTIRFIILTLGAIAMLFPLLWMVTIALKGNNDVFKIPPEWFPGSFTGPTS